MVIDEFQRLSDDHYSLIANWARSNGILVALGSSYGIVNRVFDRGSPLLGLFMPLEINIISYEDTLARWAISSWPRYIGTRGSYLSWIVMRSSWVGLGGSR